jgi:DNA-binding LacI/PurR family transcriptional regulator
MRAAYAAHLRIPQDISVIGFDDIDLAPYFEPPLTTVAQPKIELGRRAVEVVLELLEGNEVARDTLLSGRLVVRESTESPEQWAIERPKEGVIHDRTAV